MKAVYCTKYGAPDFLEIRDVARPTPKDNEILIKTVATPVSMADTMMRRGVPKFGRLFLGLRQPNKPIIGTGFAGIVADIGKDVTTFQPGDRVFGEAGLNFGAYAEYVTTPADGAVATIPESMRFEDAAPLADGAMTVMNFLTDQVSLEPGQSILIIGASGGLGTAAVQLANHLGADVTGVCSGRNAELVKSLGARAVIDYTTQDFTQLGETYDVVFDTVGKSSFSRSKPVLKADGVYLSPVLSVPLLFQMLATRCMGRKKAKFSATGLRSPADLRGFLKRVKALIEDGALKTIIDRSYPFEQMIEAHRYVDTGHKRGNVIVTFG